MLIVEFITAQVSTLGVFIFYLVRFRPCNPTKNLRPRRFDSTIKRVPKLRFETCFMSIFSLFINQIIMDGHSETNIRALQKYYEIFSDCSRKHVAKIVKPNEALRRYRKRKPMTSSRRR